MYSTLKYFLVNVLDMECAKLRMGCVLCWCNQSFLWGPGSVNNHQLRPGDYFSRHLSHFDDL